MFRKKHKRIKEKNDVEELGGEKGGQLDFAYPASLNSLSLLPHSLQHLHAWKQAHKNQS